MNSRRHLLAATGSAAAALLSGCMSTSDDDVSPDTTTETTAKPSVDVDTICAGTDGCLVEIEVSGLESGAVNVLAGPYVFDMFENGTYVYRVNDGTTVKVTYQNELLYGEHLQTDDGTLVRDATGRAGTDGGESA
ncbi:hypothetical protein [Halarchaeum sp. P4]|uniref:hypothetical protein n=1 Tax=Halarchaeum sp. P4 TaxID=3421639 RepID=UPI003EBC03EE